MQVELSDIPIKSLVPAALPRLEAPAWRKHAGCLCQGHGAILLVLTRVLCVFVSIHLHSCVLAFLYIYTCMRAERGSEGEGAEEGKHDVITAALR